jgi:hypothetical protein
MKKNVGSYDAGVRFIIGCILIFAAINGIYWGWIGLALVLTSGGFCPIWWILKIDSAAWEERWERRRK